MTARASTTRPPTTTRRRQPSSSTEEWTRARHTPSTWNVCRGSSSLLHLRDRAPGRLVHRHGAVAVLDAVLLQDLEAVVFPGAGDAEDGDRVGGVAAAFDAALDD